MVVIVDVGLIIARFGIDEIQFDYIKSRSALSYTHTNICTFSLQCNQLLETTLLVLLFVLLYTYDRYHWNVGKYCIRSEFLNWTCNAQLATSIPKIRIYTNDSYISIIVYIINIMFVAFGKCYLCCTREFKLS